MLTKELQVLRIYLVLLPIYLVNLTIVTFKEYTYEEEDLGKLQLKASIHNSQEEGHHMEHQPYRTGLQVEHKVEDYPLGDCYY